jgi:hypothetical protein
MSEQSASTLQLAASPLASLPARAAERGARTRGHQQRLALIMICGALALGALGAVLAISIQRSENASNFRNTGKGPQGGPRNAMIADELGHRCRLFDNKTGRMTELTPCGEPLLDSRGMPIPAGTIHRLDAIRKSFSDRDRL